MNYSTETIYKNTGQFDKIVVVTFKFNSESFKRYGNYIVGKFYYTPKERTNIQQIIDSENSHTDGLVKFVASDSPKLSKENVDELAFSGLLASDIIEILQFEEVVENKFIKKDIRELPEPIKINSPFTEEDEEDLMLWLNGQRLKTSYRLIPEERHRHNAVLFRKNEKAITKPEEVALFKDLNTGEIKPELKIYYLESKFKYDKLSDDELTELKKLYEKKAGEKIEILSKELKKSSERWKEIGINYTTGVKILLHLSTNFETQRITNGKFPVWWDYEKFLHIFMRHVNETQVGERFGSKTVFQYKLKDIKDLIKIVLGKVEEEIIEHFMTKPGKDFIRIGERSVYYNGDYYSFHIDKNGRLMTFHKK